MKEAQPKQEANAIRAWHVLKSLTGKIVLNEQIAPGQSIPFGGDYFTKTYIELDTEGQKLKAVRKIRGRNDVVSERLVTKSVEKFNFFGQAPREEIIIEK